MISGHDAGTTGEVGRLAVSRREFHACLTARGDALFELTDALLCADGPVRSLVELSLVGEHRRGHDRVPSAWHHVERHANNQIEADHSQLKHRLRPMRGLRSDRTAQTIVTGHAFVQNLRRGHHELGVDASPATRVAAAFTELAHAI